jgi:multimeric flavodoxin WrbA
MKVTILNGNPDPGNQKFDDYIKGIEKALCDERHHVTSFLLRDMDIKYCNGCFGCWVKTPGECVFADDSYKVRSEYIGSDLVIFSSPIIAGFTSALLKKTQEKLLPLIHPYFEKENGEFHHRRRYDNYPNIGVIVNCDEQFSNCVEEIYKRIGIQFKSSLQFFKTNDNLISEVLHEINNI